MRWRAGSKRTSFFLFISSRLTSLLVGDIHTHDEPSLFSKSLTHTQNCAKPTSGLIQDYTPITQCHTPMTQSPLQSSTCEYICLGNKPQRALVQNFSPNNIYNRKKREIQFPLSVSFLPRPFFLYQSLLWSKSPSRVAETDKSQSQTDPYMGLAYIYG